MKFAELFEQAVGNFNENRPRAVDKNFLRGGRPLNKKALDELKDMGVETVICLLRGGKKYDNEVSGAEGEGPMVKKAGMNFVHISMDERINPKKSDIDAFIKAAKEGGKIYAPCSAGKDRVGLMSAIYDVDVLGKTYEQAYQRYLEGGHDFYSWTNLDKFFYEYERDKDQQKQLHPDKAVMAVVKNKRDAQWLLNYIDPERYDA